MDTDKNSEKRLISRRFCVQMKIRRSRIIPPTKKSAFQRRPAMA